MQQKNVNYTLDFVIPSGQEGATGPQGVQGEMGPTGPASLEALLYTDFFDSSKEGYLDIFKNTILPSNATVFTPKTNQIEINEPGNYEFIVSGSMEGLTANEVLSIGMTVTNEDGVGYSVMLASIVADSRQEYFSQTMLMTFQKKQTIAVYFRKDSTSSSETQDISLLIALS